jgi:hypothetical protein
MCELVSWSNLYLTMHFDERNWRKGTRLFFGNCADFARCNNPFLSHDFVNDMSHLTVAMKHLA